MSLVVAVAQFVSTRVIGAALKDWKEAREREAADILNEELKNGFHGEVDWDERTDLNPALGMAARYIKAVDDGAARENLRLLAQVIAGLKKFRTFDEDSFRRWANILEQLTRDELVLIGKAYIIKKGIKAAGAGAVNDFSEKLRDGLTKSGFSRDDIDALCASVARTGLIVPVSAFGTMAYMPTDWLLRLGDLANIEGCADTK